MLVRPAFKTTSRGSDPRFFAVVEQARIDANATLELDRDLNVLRVRQHPEATAQRPEEYWRSLWKIVIQGYAYVEQPSAERGSASNQ